MATSRRAPRSALALLALAAGCYRYQPTPAPALRVEETARLQLTAPAVERLRSSPAREWRLLSGFGVEGVVSRAASDSLVLTVAHTPPVGPGVRPATEFVPLALRLDEVRAASVRRLDRRRSWLAGGVVGALVVGTAAYAIANGGFATGTSRGAGGPNEGRVPVGVRVP